MAFFLVDRCAFLTKLGAMLTMALGILFYSSNWVLVAVDDGETEVSSSGFPNFTGVRA